MRFREELVLNIRAPREAVWAAFQDFSSWPSWAKAIKEVSREGSAWRFRARGQPPVDLVWVAEATERRPPEYLEFRSVPGVPHNLEISGWLRLSESEDGGTHLELLFEGHPHYDSPLLDKAAEWYATLFGEPNKLLKVTFEQFKAHLEKAHHSTNLSASTA
ncbi:SRPBCC family protein [Meiothermus taiwanensis]|jgi:uncharacterized membrane protein|uniref:Polyketide cyclase / dehydrase and lipid transport n=2 Tax=Meiothermus taiwanensis TaxID=172827 RepID=A0A399E3T8_9DEIN|nr:SRPBCC family protein [Meiothermus taiwanensis]AWR86626.1 polyketide cyclase/dehydrase [Meiothermus taiwanensis WR-220]KIQ55570.1 polyketide cyclase [Meiothermus taiwanensis]KZK15988.1 polyketide cyclase [Meiothermus taiwanensis]RIH78588.1 Polyketide cyclase / dehydrase and lipid transport [Meiothermus taiwanensis]